jgi:hypothetical protein
VAGNQKNHHQYGPIEKPVSPERYAADKDIIFYSSDGF